MTTIPVVDVSPALSGEDVAGVVAELRRAATEVGFLQIVGHGVDPALLDAVYATIARIAELSPAEKAALLSPTGHQFRGLVGGKDADGHQLVESIQVNTFDDAGAALAAGVDPRFVPYFHPNVWPATIDGLRDAWLDCSGATRELGRFLMGLFALALGLPRSHFDECFTLDVTQFGINWYPPQPEVDDPRSRLLTRAHSDSGVLTLLHQRGDYEGLQVLAPDGEWIDVPVMADAFVINVGDLMHRWTNGRWPASMHRVVTSTRAGDSRASIVTFLLPAVDTVIAPLDSVVDAEGPRFVPVTQFDWEAEYLKSAGYQPGGRSSQQEATSAH